MAYTTIDDPEAYFQTVVYTGNGSAGHAITLDGDTNMQPDLCWFGNRETVYPKEMYDSARGVGKRLTSEGTAIESDEVGLTAFSSDGFTVGTRNQTNQSGKSIVARCWKESATAGFDMVLYIGNGTDDTDISHNLSATPNLIMVKNRDAEDAWQVYHHKNTSAPETDYLVLDTNAATVDAADRWSDEVPTSSVFTLGDADEVNTNTENYIAYCFAEKQGFSKFGSYEGNGNADGAFVYTGFRPAFVMTKSVDSTSAWHMFDNKRSGYNPDNNAIEADTTAIEATTDQIDILSNGFKCRITTDPNVAETYVYMAFAEAPFVNSNGVPCNAR